MTYQCALGCRDPRAKDGRMWHETSNECAFENYNPDRLPGRKGRQKAKGHPGTAAPAPTASAPSPPSTAPPAAPRAAAAPTATSTLTLGGGSASVTKGARAVPPVEVDYVVDGPHTKALWNFGLRAIYFVHVKIDEWAFDWHKHLPKEQFQLSKNADMSVEMDPRNLYSRSATWFTKTICRCKTLQAAHAAIDGIIFFEAFGGIGVALIFHYETIYKESPKLKAKRAAKKAKEEAAKNRGIPPPSTATTAPYMPTYTVTTGSVVP